jgi:EAL domain-containing protein (putative c-di-GMP-specific phosphodiesterase class I)
MLQRILSDSGLKPCNLTLEITESRIVDNDPVTLQNMQSICDLGVHIAIDDFGTGYSSLAYLHKLPFNCLKIDRTFVNNLKQENLDSSIVAAIINMTRSMKVNIVAEGIETIEQANMLTQLACSQGQGFLYSRPVPFEEWPVDLT